jgi:hypothetical protein
LPLLSCAAFLFGHIELSGTIIICIVPHSLQNRPRKTWRHPMLRFCLRIRVRRSVWYKSGSSWRGFAGTDEPNQDANALISN